MSAYYVAMPYKDPQKKKEYNKKYRKDHRKEMLEYIKHWRKENKKQIYQYLGENRQKYQEYDRKRRAKDPEKHRSKSREDYQKHREARIAAQKNWVTNNPEKARSNWLTRRARVNNAAGEAHANEIKARAQLFGNKCAYCTIGKYEELDHVLPLARGGTNWPANLRPACRKCNKRKSSNPNWRKFKFFL